MKYLLSLFTLLITISSCNSSKKAIETNNQMLETLSGTFAITQIRDHVLKSDDLVITFDDTTQKITGFAGCNRFFGDYSTKNNTIVFQNIASTEMFCPGEINKIESYFLKTLSTVNAFTLKDRVLSLIENDENVIKAIQPENGSKKSDRIDGHYKTSVTYTALSRGSFDFILISKSNISISKDRNLQNINEYSISTKDWEALNELIEAVNLDTFQELKPPTEKHTYDGAAHATLALQIGDIQYTTPTFDHGNPPKEIETLVNKVLSLKENTVKQ